MFLLQIDSIEPMGAFARTAPHGGSLVMLSETLAFCTFCGTRLQEDNCGCQQPLDVTTADAVTPAAARRSRFSWLSVWIAILAVAATGGSALDQVADERDLRQGDLALLRQSQDAQAVSLQASQATIDTLAERVAELEEELTQAPASTRVSKAAQPSVYTVVTDAGSGSGFAVKGEGGRSLLVTNFHVVSDGYLNGDTSVVVRRRGGDRHDGRVVDVSESNDLAVIEVTAVLPTLDLSTKRLPGGAPVFALGSPLGLGGTVTSGIVSAYRTLDSVNYLQFSAPISPGNSGGPVLDSSGEVVGVTVQKVVSEGAEGLGFAIPTDRVCDALDLC